MDLPGEFFAPILMGPLRGIPALHLLMTSKSRPVEGLVPMIQEVSDRLGLNQKGKLFIYLQRNLEPEMVKALVDWGAFVIGVKDPTMVKPWTRSCHHVMGVSTSIKYINGKLDSFTYCPDIDSMIREPEFSEANEKIPKFLVVDGFNSNVGDFLRNSQYPWALQVAPSYIFIATGDKEGEAP